MKNLTTKAAMEAVYGVDKNGDMHLIARDLDASHAKEKADEYWKNTGRAAVIVKQQYVSSAVRSDAILSRI